MDDKCVMCGAYIPEGSMVCWDCAHPMTVSYNRPVLFTLWGWKVFSGNRVFAQKDLETVLLEADSLEGIIELIMMRERKNDKN